MSDTQLRDWRPVPGGPGREFRVGCTVSPVDDHAGGMEYEIRMELRTAPDPSENAPDGLVGR